MLVGVNGFSQGVPARVGVGVAHYGPDAEGLDGFQSLHHLLMSGVNFARENMLDQKNQRLTIGDGEAEPFGELCCGELRDVQQPVEAWIARVMNAERLLPEAQHSLETLAVGHEMQVRELGNRMPHLVIDVAYDPVAAGDMRDSDIHVSAG